MKELAVSELAVSDIGSRIIAIDNTGNAFDGTLTKVWASEWKHGKTPDEMVRTNLTITADESSSLELSNLPLDFRVQVERENGPTHE